MTLEVGQPAVAVLLVEDNPDDAYLLRKLVDRARRDEGSVGGFTLRHVTTLADALASLAAERFDAVLLDLHLPDAEGLTTLERLRPHAPGVPVVVLTGMESDAIALEAIRIGAQDYLGKDRMDGKLVLRTVRHAMERQQLVEVQQKAQRYLDIARVAIVVIEHDGRVSLINRTGVEVLKRPESAIVGQDWLEAFVPANRRAAVAAAFRALLDGDATGRTELEHAVVDGTGSLRLMAWHIAVMPDRAGRPARLICSGEDVTERRRQEQTLRRYTQRLEVLRAIDRAILSARSPRHLAEAALGPLRELVPALRASVVLVTDAQCEVLAVNGVTVGEAKPGARFALDEQGPLAESLRRGEPLYLPDLAGQGGHLTELLRREGARAVLVVPLITEGQLVGSLNLAGGQIDPFTAEHREIAADVAGILAIGIRQRRLNQQVRQHSRELEARVRERTAQLRETNRELEAFAYSVSHDLRNPLWNIQGFAEALRERYGERIGFDGREFIDFILQAAENMDGLIRDLLAYSRLSRGELRPVPVALDPLVDETLHAFAGSIRERQAGVEVRRPLPTVLGNSAILHQIVDNLIGNALKFTPPARAPYIRIHGECDHGRARLWVEDNGIGIPPERRDAVFRAFERLHEEYPGTGVGLATVRRAVERLGGTVGVESQPGQGSRFWVELPQADGTAPERLQ